MEAWSTNAVAYLYLFVVSYLSFELFDLGWVRLVGILIPILPYCVLVWSMVPLLAFRAMVSSWFGIHIS